MNLQNYLQSEQATKDSQDFQLDSNNWDADKLAQEVNRQEKDFLILI